LSLSAQESFQSLLHRSKWYVLVPNSPYTWCRIASSGYDKPDRPVSSFRMLGTVV